MSSAIQWIETNLNLKSVTLFNIILSNKLSPHLNIVHTGFHSTKQTTVSNVKNLD